MSSSPQLDNIRWCARVQTSLLAWTGYAIPEAGQLRHYNAVARLQAMQGRYRSMPAHLTAGS